MGLTWFGSALEHFKNFAKGFWSHYKSSANKVNTTWETRENNKEKHSIKNCIVYFPAVGCTPYAISPADWLQTIIAAHGYEALDDDNVPDTSRQPLYINIAPDGSLDLPEHLRNIVLEFEQSYENTHYKRLKRCVKYLTKNFGDFSWKQSQIQYFSFKEGDYQLACVPMRIPRGVLHQKLWNVTFSAVSSSHSWGPNTLTPPP